jgi:hypothetical protein
MPQLLACRITIIVNIPLYWLSTAVGEARHDHCCAFTAAHGLARAASWPTLQFKTPTFGE